MHKIFFYIFITLISHQIVFSQENNLEENKIHSFVQQKATPKEGLKVFYENFAKEFKSPRLSKGVSEIIIRLKFIVEKDGTFSNIEVVDDEQHVGKEAIRVLKSMPSWNPAIHEGQFVRSSFTLPIKVKVDEEESSDEILLTSKKAIKSYVDSLETYKMTNDFFEFSCNCGLYKSSKNDTYKTEEFFYESVDKKIYYNVVLRTVDVSDTTDPFEAIIRDVENQNGRYNKITFNNHEAMEVILQMPNGDFINEYRTIFIAKETYFAAINVMSYNKQIVDLVFNQLKQKFILKI